MTIILLTNPDVILYKGTDVAVIAKEIVDYEKLMTSGILNKKRELVIVQNPILKFIAVFDNQGLHTA